MCMGEVSVVETKLAFFFSRIDFLPFYSNDGRHVFHGEFFASVLCEMRSVLQNVHRTISSPPDLYGTKCSFFVVSCMTAAYCLPALQA